MKNPLKFHYVGDRNSPGKNGVMTVATEVQKNGYLKFGFAFCSPVDNFSKKTGRELSLENMAKKNCYERPFSGNSANDLIDLFNNVMFKADKPQLWRKRILVNIHPPKVTQIVERNGELVAVKSGLSYMEQK